VKNPYTWTKTDRVALSSTLSTKHRRKTVADTGKYLKQLKREAMFVVQQYSPEVPSISTRAVESDLVIIVPRCIPERISGTDGMIMWYAYNKRLTVGRAGQEVLALVFGSK
jgi:hypothetical protein